MVARRTQRALEAGSCGWRSRVGGRYAAAAVARTLRDVDPDARAHRAGDRQALEVLALGARRPRPVHRVDEGGEVPDERVGLEARLADRDVDDRALVDLELDAAALDLLDRPLEVERDRAGLRVRHQAAPAEDLAEPADQAHRVRRRERDVEVEPAGLDLLGEVLAADLVGAGAERLLGLVALGEDGDADDLAGAVRQDDRAADHLVGVARVDAEPEVGLDGRVEADVRSCPWRAGQPRPGCRGARDRRASPPRGTSCRVPCRGSLPGGRPCRPPLSRGVCRAGLRVPARQSPVRRSSSRRPRCPSSGRCPR